MRGLAIKLILFFGVMEGLQRVDLMVLLAGISVGVALIVCADYVFRMRSEG